MENPTFHPLDYVSVLRRRMWWFIAPLALAIVIGAALVTWLPREYKTAATLGVTLPALTPELLRQPTRGNDEERTRVIRQTLYSPGVLERVVREEGFDQQMSLREASTLVRSRTEIAIIKAEDNRTNTDQFTIAYRDSTPETAQRVANRLADAFVQENVRKREVRAEETSAFIGKQLEASQQRLSVLEGQLRTAKESFMGALPEQTGANVAMVTGLQQQLETTANAIRGEQDRLSMVERQIESLRAGASQDVPVPGVPATTGSPAAVRVVQLERQLEVARANYTDKHPEIIRLKDDLAAARAAVQADLGRPEGERLASLRVDPTYQALLADAERARMRMRQLERQEINIRSQIAMYRARVDSAPRVEQQMAALQREYDLEKRQYGSLMERMRNAEIAENLERSGGNELFTVLARAPFPTSPFSPNPQRLWVIALLLGVVLGGGLALGREYLDRSIHDTRGLNDFDLPVLGEIPRIARVA